MLLITSSHNISSSKAAQDSRRPEPRNVYGEQREENIKSKISSRPAKLPQLMHTHMRWQQCQYEHNTDLISTSHLGSQVCIQLSSVCSLRHKMSAL